MLNSATRVLRCVAVGFGLLGLAGCQSSGTGHPEPHEREWLHNDFEELGNWLGGNPGLSSEKTHSGHYALRVDTLSPYSLTYRALLGTLTPHHRPRRLSVSLWAWVPDAAAEARFVVSITPASTPDKPSFYKAVFLTDGAKLGRWQPVRRDFTLPDDLHATDQLVMYLWVAESKVPAYVDDLRVTEFW